MKIAPLRVQPFLYQEGTYFADFTDFADLVRGSVQTTGGLSLASGVTKNFVDSYNALGALPEMTQVSEGDENCFLMLQNSTAHNPILLREPEYEPAQTVDNTQYDAEHADRFVYEGVEMHVDTAYQMAHYQSNMAALKQLGKWFDSLRALGVYDNTRIILVADHGWALGQFPERIFDASGQEPTQYNAGDLMLYNPLLMVKDFGSSGFTVDERFMTNADTPTLASDGLFEDARNPFTGKAICSDAKDSPEQHVFYTDYWGVTDNHGNTFLPGDWYALSGQNIFDTQSWRWLGRY